MNLWGLQIDKKHDKNIFEIDEDCLSCSLSKYKPMIEKAFKLACITYKPGKIPFYSKMFERSSLITLKRAHVEKVLSS